LAGGRNGFFLRGAKVSQLKQACCLFLLSSLAAVSVCAADPPAPINPLKMFSRSPFSAEFEVYSGGITGDSIGAAYKSATRGDLGARFTFGFMKGINFSLGYMYSNQTRSFSAVTPATGTLPTGTALLRAGNLNMAFGSGEFNLIQTQRAKFYISPGIGFARNAGRNMTVITPLGAASAPVLAGRAVTFNLGAGVKIYPHKRIGFRIDVRDHVSQGGTGTLNPDQDLTISGTTITNPQQYFGNIPVQNNLVFTLGLIFRIL
jgi:hypothetical protein